MGRRLYEPESARLTRNRVNAPHKLADAAAPPSESLLIVRQFRKLRCAGCHAAYGSRGYFRFIRRNATRSAICRIVSWLR